MIGSLFLRSFCRVEEWNHSAWSPSLPSTFQGPSRMLLSGVAKLWKKWITRVNPRTDPIQGCCLLAPNSTTSLKSCCFAKFLTLPQWSCLGAQYCRKYGRSPYLHEIYSLAIVRVTFQADSPHRESKLGCSFWSLILLHRPDRPESRTVSRILTRCYPEVGNNQPFTASLFCTR